MVEGIILKHVIKDASRRVNEQMGEVVELSNIALQVQQGLLEVARKLGELATELYDVIKTQ